jgi:SAM-dependent methyltransferase
MEVGRRAAVSELIPCRICRATTVPLGTKRGRHEPRDFAIRHCPGCHFSFVANPWTDYARIYSDDYYAGRGADPLVDYFFELQHPERTIRIYEWRGIVRAVISLYPVGPHSRWLDFGCGNGGLVRYIRQQGVCEAVGFEEGSIAVEAADAGIPIVRGPDLAALAGSFDIVTAIEVLEHIEQPLEALRQMHALLKPGGLFFFTTGNARPVRDRLLSWPYVIPEIHISFFEPATAAAALSRSGFVPEFRGFLPGFTDIIRFKALKNLGYAERAWWHSVLPWPVLARLLDVRFQISAHPVGWARDPK